MNREILRWIINLNLLSTSTEFFVRRFIWFVGTSVGNFAGETSGHQFLTHYDSYGKQVFARLLLKLSNFFPNVWTANPENQLVH